MYRKNIYNDRGEMIFVHYGLLRKLDADGLVLNATSLQLQREKYISQCMAMVLHMAAMHEHMLTFDSIDVLNKSFEGATIGELHSRILYALGRIQNEGEEVSKQTTQSLLAFFAMIAKHYKIKWQISLMKLYSPATQSTQG